MLHNKSSKLAALAAVACLGIAEASRNWSGALQAPAAPTKSDPELTRMGVPAEKALSDFFQMVRSTSLQHVQVASPEAPVHIFRKTDEESVSVVTIGPCQADPTSLDRNDHYVLETFRSGSNPSYQRVEFVAKSGKAEVLALGGIEVPIKGPVENWNALSKALLSSNGVPSHLHAGERSQATETPEGERFLAGRAEFLRTAIAPVTRKQAREFHYPYAGKVNANALEYARMTAKELLYRISSATKN